MQLELELDPELSTISNKPADKLLQNSLVFNREEQEIYHEEKNIKFKRVFYLYWHFYSRLTLAEIYKSLEYIDMSLKNI